MGRRGAAAGVSWRPPRVRSTARFFLWRLPEIVSEGILSCENRVQKERFWFGERTFLVR